MTKKEDCFLCGEPALIECQKCQKGAWFCSQEHLEDLHQPPFCFPLKVEKSDAAGRRLITTQDLQPLEVIFTDSACPSGTFET